MCRVESQAGCSFQHPEGSGQKSVRKKIPGDLYCSVLCRIISSHIIPCEEENRKSNSPSIKFGHVLKVSLIPKMCHITEITEVNRQIFNQRIDG